MSENDTERSGEKRLDRIEEQCIKELARVDPETVPWVSEKVGQSTGPTLNALRRCKRLELVECSHDEQFWSLTPHGELLVQYLDTGEDDA